MVSPRKLRMAVATALFFCAASAPAVLLPPSDDATTSALKPAKNAGRTGTLQTGSKLRAWLKFDLGQIPPGISGAQISRVILRLYPSVLSTDSSFHISLAAGDWTQETLTEANAPSVLEPELIAVPLPKGMKGAFINLDVTEIVKGWLEAPATNHGFVLSAPAGAATIGFDSKENSAGGHYPQLDVALKPLQGVQGPQGERGPQGDTGPAGLKGDKGDMGLPGIQGESGVQGNPGPVGPIGLTGAPGTDGTDFVYGDGSAGAFVAPNDSMLDVSNPQFTDFTVPTGATLRVPSGMSIRCRGKFINAGTLLVEAAGSYSIQTKESERGIARTSASYSVSTIGYSVPADLAIYSHGEARTLAEIKTLFSFPTYFGGSGGPSSSPFSWARGDVARGGGSLRVISRDVLINSGSIFANGETGVSALVSDSSVPPLNQYTSQSMGGGGGGGVLLASNMAIHSTGLISAAGGAGGAGILYFVNTNKIIKQSSGGGGGGLIRLLAPTVTADGTLSVLPGNNGVIASDEQTLYLGSAGGASVGAGGEVTITKSKELFSTTSKPAGPGLLLIDRCNPAALLLH
ncbi:MAG: Collagen triple helix repeat-containing protein [Chthoniobacteraceae bacterium]|nr:Collagen triple helix repeat-containing protein [Chthoniobacteraceae bacterium]